MNLFNTQVFTFLWTIMSIDGERWYSTAFIESGEVTLKTKRSDQRTGDQGNSQVLEKLHENNSHLIEIPPPEHFLNELLDDQKISGLRRNSTLKYMNTIRGIQSRKKQFSTKNPTGLRFLNKLGLNQTSKARFFEVFNMVEFDHVICTSSDGLEGICLHNYECESSGGTDMGECADGYGTCCVTQFSCDSNSSALLGWFTNPGFPSPSNEILACTFSVNKASEEIKQLRVDFNNFELSPPSGGICQQDQFIISGQNVNSLVPILCGINNGQHVYVEVGRVDGPLYFTIQTTTSASRLFSIKITQLTDHDELFAPFGCLQYFKEPEGYIQSFNYFDASEFGVKRTPSYLNNLNYAIFVERAPECCSVTYSNSGNMQIINYDTDGLPVIPPNQAGVEIFNCPSDWLLLAATRLCGDRFNDGSVIEDFSYNAPITDTNAGPIVVWFRSDTAYVGRGFKLKYQQNRCSNPFK